MGSFESKAQDSVGVGALRFAGRWPEESWICVSRALGASSVKCHCALCVGGRCPGSRNRAGSAAEKGLSERMNAHVEACGLGSFLRRGGVLLEAMKTRLKLALLRVWGGWLECVDAWHLLSELPMVDEQQVSSNKFSFTDYLGLVLTG